MNFGTVILENFENLKILKIWKFENFENLKILKIWKFWKFENFENFNVLLPGARLGAGWPMLVFENTPICYSICYFTPKCYDSFIPWKGNRLSVLSIKAWIGGSHFPDSVMGTWISSHGRCQRLEHILEKAAYVLEINYGKGIWNFSRNGKHRKFGNF